MAEESPTVTEFVAAGLYDPSTADASDRRHVLEWLAGQGFTIDEMRAAAYLGDLAALAGDALRRAGVHLSVADMADRTGIPLERLVEVRRAAGFGPVPLDAPVYTDDDQRAYEVLVEASNLFSWGELVQFLRVMGSSVSRIAEAANTLYLHDVEQPMRLVGTSEIDLAHRSVQAMQLAGSIDTVLRMLLRLHLDQAIARSRQAYDSCPGSGLMVHLAVGFVDLVGFTPHTTRLAPQDLASLVTRFEATAHDVVTDLGGRLVKLIGDEVMFVAVSPRTGCDIAVALLTAFGDSADLTPRGGLAYGDVLARGGDYFGPTVNLAARLAEQAVPGEVLATPMVASDTAGHRAETAGRRLLKGFSDPVAVVSLTAS